MKNNELGAQEDYMGSVDLFGLDEFGQPVGLGANWGAAIGAATQSSVAMAVRRFTDFADYAEGIGAALGAGAGAIMLAFPGARNAGWTAAITSLVSGGIRQIETMMGPSAADIARMQALVTAVSPGTNGIGLPTVEAQQLVPGSAGMSGVSLGLPTIEATASLGAAAGPPQLQNAGDYGLANNPAAQQAQLVGAPGLSGLGGHFGSTIFG